MDRYKPESPESAPQPQSNDDLAAALAAEVREAHPELSETTIRELIDGL
jgi:hypothetical protein